LALVLVVFGLHFLGNRPVVEPFTALAMVFASVYLTLCTSAFGFALALSTLTLGRTFALRVGDVALVDSDDIYKGVVD